MGRRTTDRAADALRAPAAMVSTVARGGGSLAFVSSPPFLYARHAMETETTAAAPLLSPSFLITTRRSLSLSPPRPRLLFSFPGGAVLDCWPLRPGPAASAKAANFFPPRFVPSPTCYTTTPSQVRIQTLPPTCTAQRPPLSLTTQIRSSCGGWDAIPISCLDFSSVAREIVDSDLLLPWTGVPVPVPVLVCACLLPRFYCYLLF